MISRAICTAIAAVLLLLFFSQTAGAQTYPIRFTRPWKVGDRYRISATGSLSQKSSTAVSNDVRAHTQDLTVEFLADATVLGIRQDGRIAKESLMINESLLSNDPLKRRLVPRGTVVEVSAEEGRPVFRMNGELVNSEIDDLLSLVISLEASETSNDDVFGTTRQRRLGESWGINSLLAARWLHEAHLEVNQESARGFVSAAKMVTAQNQDCLVISGSLAADTLVGELDGIIIENGQVQIAFTDSCPIDTRRHCVEHSQQIRIQLLATLRPYPDSSAEKVDLTTEMNMTAHYSPL